MKKHTLVYMRFFGYKIAEDCFCEICGKPAVDVNHIKARGMGGSKEKDYIENLMGICREHHEEYGDRQLFRPFLIQIHLLFMFKHGLKSELAKLNPSIDEQIKNLEE